MAIQDGIGYLRATFNQNLHFTENFQWKGWLVTTD